MEPGELLGVIGPNGSGKTTLFNCVTGVLRPSGGQVRFKGEDITGLSADLVYRRGIARTFQLIQLFPEMTVLENMLLAAQERHGTLLGPPGPARGPRSRRPGARAPRVPRHRRLAGPPRLEPVLRPAEAPRLRHGAHVPARGDPPRRAPGRRQPHHDHRSSSATSTRSTPRATPSSSSSTTWKSSCRSAGASSS